jgi:hypothetical protein
LNDVNMRELSEPRSLGGYTIELGVTAWSALRLSIDEFAQLRKQPGSRFPPAVTPQFFKHSDEQSIASLAAVCQAMGQCSSPAAGYSSWGCVAAPRFIGRAALAASMHRFQTDGPWGASVQIVPQRSQHSVASTISLALGIQGPCIGAGGGADGEPQAFLAATSLLLGEHLPGAWLVLSGWDPELAVEPEGRPTCESSCLAIALALVAVPQQSLSASLRLRSEVGSQAASPPTSSLLHALTNIREYVIPRAPRSISLVGSYPGGLTWELDLRPEAAMTPTFATRQVRSLELVP